MSYLLDLIVQIWPFDFSFPPKVLNLGHFSMKNPLSVQVEIISTKMQIGIKNVVKTTKNKEIGRSNFGKLFVVKTIFCIAGGSRSSHEPNFMGPLMEAVES
jgi:hypothetical protein